MMKKGIFLFLSLWLFSITLLLSQTARGIRIDDGADEEIDGNYRMLVIGISAYKNIPSLEYADRDATLFYNYMLNAYGDKFNGENAKLILNEEATAANIYSDGFNWLVEEAEDDETVIIYFAGHGDVENVTMNKHGFLLAHDSPKSVYAAGGTVLVDMLESYVQTLVAEKNSKVILIADACRSGSLAGGAKGASTTAAALQRQWNNVIKIMSSQPGEVSFEGTQWNNGGGVFTYYLVKGFLGQADRNRDGRITIRELDNYLYDNVSEDTKNSQTPNILGNNSEVVAYVNEELTVQYASLLNDGGVSNQVAMNTRGMGDNIKDPKLKELYDKFTQSVDNGILTQGDDGNNAYDYLIEIEKSDKSKIWSRNAKRRLVGSLQNRYVAFISNIIENGNISDLFKNSDEKLEVEKQVSLALELIDENYPNYSNLVAANIILKSFNVEFETKQSGFEDFIPIIDSCINLTPDNSLLFYIKGKLFDLTDKYKDAQACYDTAILYSPTFIFPLINKAEFEFKNNNYNEVIELLTHAKIEEKSISGYNQWHQMMVQSLHKLNKRDEVDRYFNQLETKALDEESSTNTLLGLTNLYKWYRSEIDKETHDNLLKKEENIIEKIVKNEESKIKQIAEKDADVDEEVIYEVMQLCENLIDYYFETDEEKTEYYYRTYINAIEIICERDPSISNLIGLMGSYIGIEEFDKAYDTLEKLVELGFRNFEMIEKSEGTEAFTKGKKYKRIKKKIKK